MPATATRTDAHRPAVLVTEDYEYLYAADLESPWAIALTRTHGGRGLLKALANLDPATEDRGYGQCHHCGARLRYAAWLRHLPTGSISERQAEAVTNAIARDAARYAREMAEAHEPKTPCPEGRYVITGEVVSIKWQSGDFGDVLKMTVKDDRNFKVYMSVPSGLMADRGDRVEVTATVEASDRDEFFGFGKRPSKARILATAGE